MIPFYFHRILIGSVSCPRLPFLVRGKGRWQRRRVRSRQTSSPGVWSPSIPANAAPRNARKCCAARGIEQLAYDWRGEHIPTFDEEMETLDRWGIELTAFWFPSALNEEARTILKVLERHGIKTSLWVTYGGGEVNASSEEHRQRVQQHADLIRPIAEAAARIGCKVGLYNHGGWFGRARESNRNHRGPRSPQLGDCL